MTLPAGSSLGPYSIVSLLGSGGMGEVYRARDPRLGRDVAVKVVSGEGVADAARRARFEQEARAAAALNHPHILAVYDVGTAEVAGVPTPYVVSELLEGETLRDRLARGKVPARVAIDLAVQIARGLAAAHEHGIVHRDVKPENLFVTKDGTAKVLDFGLAKLRDAGVPAGDMDTTAEARVGTGPGMVLGTVGYMAPEQVRAQSVDHRADIFALGCVLYELLGGQRAFSGASAVETLHAIFVMRLVKDGTTRLVLRRMDSGALVDIPGTDGAGAGHWSPDGRSLIFRVGPNLRRVDSESGAAPEAFLAGSLAVGPNLALTWGRAGTLLALDSRQELKKIAAQGGPPESVPLSLPGGRAPAAPEFVGDGRRFLFTTTPTDTSGLYLASLGDPAPVLVADGISGRVVYVEPGYVVYRRQSALMAQAIDLNVPRLVGEAAVVAAFVSENTFSASPSVIVHGALASGAISQCSSCRSHHPVDGSAYPRTAGCSPRGGPTDASCSTWPSTGR